MKFNILLLLLTSVSLMAYSQTETSFALGKKAYLDDNYAEALKYFEQAAKDEPQNAQVPYLTGRVYLDLSNYKQSASFLEKAIAMDSSKSNWIYECALVYYAIPDYRKSLRYMELAGAKGYKRTTDYLENLGNAYINVKQYDTGIALLKQVLKKKPADHDLLYQVAQAYYRSGKYQDAIDNWNDVLKLDKENADVLYMIGVCYQKLGDNEKGQQLCDKAIEIDPSLRSRRQRITADF